MRIWWGWWWYSHAGLTKDMLLSPYHITAVHTGGAVKDGLRDIASPQRRVAAPGYQELVAQDAVRGNGHSAAVEGGRVCGATADLDRAVAQGSLQMATLTVLGDLLGKGSVLDVTLRVHGLGVE